jgi:hypothetical protein
MKDPREHLDEYLDGLLSEEDRLQMEEALASDPELGRKLEKARRFRSLLESIRGEELAVRRILAEVGGKERRRGLLMRLSVAAAAAAAVLVVWLGIASQERSHEEEVVDRLFANAREYGRRMGEITAVRRDGRVPRQGVMDLEMPHAPAYGVVFAAALDPLGVEVKEDALEAVKSLVADHFVAMRTLGDDLESECRRSEASLDLYRNLRNEAGRAVADAYYDVFRPGLATLRTVRRVRPGTLAFVVRN